MKSEDITYVKVCDSIGGHCVIGEREVCLLSVQVDIGSNSVVRLPVNSLAQW